MILYAAEGRSNAGIARRLETAAEVVGGWRKRFFEQRMAGLEDRERAGRPRRFSAGADRRGEGDRLRAAQGAWPAAVARLAR
jgi:transposase